MEISHTDHFLIINLTCMDCKKEKTVNIEIDKLGHLNYKYNNACAYLHVFQA